MVDSTRNTRKVSFQKRPAEIEFLRTISMRKFRGLDPYRKQMRLFLELDDILTAQNSDDNALQALDRRKKEEKERSLEKKNKAQGKRKREKETESPGKQADEVQRKRRREEEKEKPIEKRAKALSKRKREKVTESPAKQADEVQRKRRREEEKEKPIEKKAKALSKRKREKVTESPAKQADEVQRKRRREEEKEKPIEKRAKVLSKRKREKVTESPAKQADKVQRKRRREEEKEKPIEKRAKAFSKRKREKVTESPAKQADKVQRKRRRAEEEEKPIEKRVMALRKRRREEETECPTEQADEVQRKKRREEALEKPVEKRGNAQRKRRRKEAKAPKKRRTEVQTECNTEQADEIQRKCKEKESEKPVERTAKAQRKRRRDRETECPAEQEDEVPRKKSRAGKPERPAKKKAKPPKKRGREKETETPVEKLDKTAQKKGDEEKMERRKQEIMELLTNANKEAERSRQEKKRLEEEARVPGCLYPESFIFHKVLGAGCYGKVMLATHCDSGKLVAVKIIAKRSLICQDRDFIMNEREVMKMVMGHPYCTQLFATFQSEDHLYYVMEFCSGGDLRKRIESKKLCDLPTMRRLAAELLCGLQFVHSKGILHGDVNPDNILLDCNGHVKLADFGIAEANMFGTETRTEEIGTELYMAPEIFNEQPFDKAVDYFALGVTLFEAAFGIYPFHKNNPRGSISCESPYYPIGAECVLVDFLNKLLCKDQKKRKAYIANIRKHRFFKGINWEQLEAGKTRAPFSACRKDLEEKMTKTTIDLYGRLGYQDLWKKQQAVFMGFSFMSDEWKAIQKLKTKNTKPKKKLN